MDEGEVSEGNPTEQERKVEAAAREAELARLERQRLYAREVGADPYDCDT